ncbi:hypothetical protein Tco_1368342 [Tanacetum coccineum]
MVPIFCDNTNAIAISNNPILHSRRKHIDIRYHFIRDHIMKGDIEIHFIPTEYQLADIFTKPLDEPTFTRLKAEELRCTAIAFDPNPPADDSEARPLKEYIIKFTLMNGKKPLTLDFKTFCEFTSLDYNKCTYVSHPSPEAMKAELAKIATDEIVLGWNYSSTKQGTNTKPKDSESLKTLNDKDSSTLFVVALSGTDVKYQVDQTQSTRFEVSIPDQNKGKTSSEVKPDIQTLLLTTVANIQALLVATDEELKDDSANDVFEAGEEMDEDVQEHQTKKLMNPLKNLIHKSISLHHQTDISLNLPKPRRQMHQTQSPPHVLKLLSLMTTTFQSLKGNWGENSMHTATINLIKKTPSHTKREKAEKEVEEKEHDVINVEKEHVVEELYHLINEEIQAHYELEEQNQKAAQEAKLPNMNKPKMIKVVQEEASKAGIDPKILSSAKGGEVF